jgi:hypothetical protein
MVSTLTSLALWCPGKSHETKCVTMGMAHETMVVKPPILTR